MQKCIDFALIQLFSNMISRNAILSKTLNTSRQLQVYKKYSQNTISF
jgi:hypothetical protein